MKIWINAGHHNKDAGGTVGKYTESAIVMEIRSKLQKMLPSAEYVPDELTLRQSIDWINERCEPEDIAIGVHLNSNRDRKIRGVECYYFKDYELAKNLSKNVSQELGIPNRGPKPDSQSYVGSLGFVRQPKCHSVVLECAYMTNMVDLDIISQESGKMKVARGIYNTVEVSDTDELKKEISTLRGVINILLKFINQIISKNHV